MASLWLWDALGGLAQGWGAWRVYACMKDYDEEQIWELLNEYGCDLPQALTKFYCTVCQRT